MRIRGLIVAALVFFILAAVLYWSEHRKPSDGTAKAATDTPPVMLKLDEASITKLELKKKDGEAVVLTRTGSGSWQITQPKPLGADRSVVSSMLSTLSSLNSQRLVEDKASDLKAYGLDHAALEVDIREKDNKTQTLLIGDDTPVGGVAYAMLAGDPRVFTVASYTRTTLDKSLNDLRDKRLLTVNSDTISRLELIRKNQTIEFGRNKEEWQVLKPKPLRADSFEVSELIRKLTDAKMDVGGSDSKDAASAFARANPIATVKVTDQSGSQELQVRKNKDTYYAKSSVADGAFKVEADLGQALDKGLDDFRNKKLFDFAFNEPEKIELQSGPKAYFLTRSGEDWWSNGKKMDPESVQTLISKLRDLTAAKFPSSGFTNPAIEATVTSDNGKRVEKVAIAKSGNDYIARRENEPALYQIEASLIDELQKAADAIKPAMATGK